MDGSEKATGKGRTTRKYILKDLLLITPPFTQLNTPYPATTYLKGFLNTKEISSTQVDLGIEVILSLFSESGLDKVFRQAAELETIISENAQKIYSQRDQYLNTIDEVIGFLQGNDSSVAQAIYDDDLLPRASRFDQANEMDWMLEDMDLQDKAKYLATLYVEDLSDFLVACIDEDFGFSRYAERLGKSANNFDELYSSLQETPTYIDSIALKILDEKLQSIHPKLVCFSVPFPGNLYSAFRSAQFIKKKYPEIKIGMGGGFPNTELRSVSDVRVFNFFDFITLDDGELPVELLSNHVLNPTSAPELKRTFLIENGKVVYNNSSLRQDYKQAEVGTPDYSDLLLDQYISVIEIANPMHSLWSDGRWLKLTMAHGCYWGKCTFCDVSLDYIKLYEPIAAKLLVDRMEEMIDQTGEKGFHFVDEAAPPALMREVALEIMRRNLEVSWWTNIRFEKSFTKDLCVLLEASGCIAVSGGLEVASDRLLALIDKGVTVEQVGQVTNHFTKAGIMVHAYLMYGYPSQTIQETVDSLEMVRQLFGLGVLQSGFWHQFALTAHSPIGLDPSAYGIVPDYAEISFANNDIDFSDSTGIDHDAFSFGLKKSLYNFMHGICFEFPLQEWFDFEIPPTTVDEDFIENCLISSADLMTRPTARILWLGGQPQVTKKGHKLQLTFNGKDESVQVSIEKEKAEWLVAILEKLTVHKKALTFAQLKADFERQFEDFELFWSSKPVNVLRERGLLQL